MSRFKKILLPFSGSASSISALLEAIKLSQWDLADLTTIYVGPVYDGDLSLIGVRDISRVLYGPAQEVFAKVLSVAEQMNIRINFVYDTGPPVGKILKYADASRTELVVLGREKISFGKMFSGQLWKNILKLATQDILIIPNGTHLQWQRLLFVYEPSAVGRSFFHRAVEIALSHGSVLEVLNLPNGPLQTAIIPRDDKVGWDDTVSKKLANSKEDSEDATLPNKRSLSRWFSYKTAKKQLGQTGADIIVFPPCQDTGFLGMLKRLHWNSLLSEINSPVLILGSQKLRDHKALTTP